MTIQRLTAVYADELAAFHAAGFNASIEHTGGGCHAISVTHHGREGGYLLVTTAGDCVLSDESPEGFLMGLYDEADPAEWIDHCDHLIPASLVAVAAGMLGVQEVQVEMPLAEAIDIVTNFPDSPKAPEAIVRVLEAAQLWLDCGSED